MTKPVLKAMLKSALAAAVITALIIMSLTSLLVVAGCAKEESESAEEQAQATAQATPSEQGTMQPETEPGDEQPVLLPEELCANACEEAREAGINLEDSPCLLNPIDEPSAANAAELSDWVCDVAHMPRQPVDNIQSNQCSSFKQGKAHHFIEVNPECEVIKVY